jgi:hypothetical protein
LLNRLSAFSCSRSTAPSHSSSVERAKNKNSDNSVFLCNSEPRKLIQQFVQTILKNHMKTMLKNATSLRIQFENWCLAMPVLSFNGS